MWLCRKSGESWGGAFWYCACQRCSNAQSLTLLNHGANATTLYDFFYSSYHIFWALVVPTNLVLGPFPPTTVDTHSHRLIAMPIPEAV